MIRANLLESQTRDFALLNGILGIIKIVRCNIESGISFHFCLFFVARRKASANTCSRSRGVICAIVLLQPLEFVGHILFIR